MIRAQRVGAGVGVAVVAVGAVVADLMTGTDWATIGLLVAILVLALRECLSLLAAGGLAPTTKLGTLLGLVLLVLRAVAEPLGLSAEEARAFLVAGVAFGAVLPLAVGIVRGPGAEGPGKKDVVSAAATAFALAYVVLFGSFLLEMRLIPGTTDVIAGTEDLRISRGLALTIIVFASVKLGDSAAYFVGRTIGRRKLCWASPKKTWEGSIASVLGAVATSVLLGTTFGWEGDQVRIIAGLGLVADLAGQGGDLLESYLKRALGVKDSSTIFGEMGGFLDMSDALLLAAPAAYLWIDLLIVRGGFPG